ncbi:NAD(P)H-dependent oxidoreductase [Flavobacterium sp. TSSA_36]|uniref:NAD(P)H-dependent oxidoreductase n=1 Tax=Flavobacterium sp. TSSA_36 TaxID=3447669 RepID=UPI003F2B0A21
MNTFLDNQKWRYATKKFDSSKKISNADLDTLKEAIRLSSSSYGLQLYKVIVVDNPEIRAQLQPAAWGQSQITEASHLFVFANQTTVGSEDIEGYLKNAEQTRNLPEGAMNAYGDFMKGGLLNLTDDAKKIWTAKQTYLALANLLNAAAELQIDTTPMEGFDPTQFNTILGLDKLNLNAAVVAAVGYRHEEDATQHYTKVRKSNEDLFITL